MNGAGRRVVVTGVGIASPVARSAAELHDAVARGVDAGVPCPEFSLNGMTGPMAAPFSDFDAKAELGRQGLRALDRTGRLTATAAGQALSDAGWGPEALDHSEVGLILGTMFGSVQTIAGFDRRGVTAGPSYVKPMEFANSVINAAAGQTAIRFDLRGLNATISGDLTAGLQALAYATDAIRTGRVVAALAGGADEICSETLYGFHRLGLLRSSRADGAGIVPGEAAALLVLEDREHALERGAEIVGEILGHGSTFDPGRGADPTALPRSLAGATRAALAESGTSPSDVAWSSLAANGTQLDKAEVEGLDQVLPTQEGRRSLTVKKAVGETLGAAGALQLVLALESLRRQPSASPGSTALVTSLGLQGRAAALLTRADSLAA